jgi:hypothetical protein
MILGIVLAAALLLLIFVLYPSADSNLITEDDDVAIIRNYVEQCLEEKATEALVLIGLQGGHIYPSEYVDEGILHKSILLKDEVSYVPSLSMMEYDMDDYVEDTIVDCINLSSLMQDTFIYIF